MWKGLKSLGESEISGSHPRFSGSQWQGAWEVLGGQVPFPRTWLSVGWDTDWYSLCKHRSGSSRSLPILSVLLQPHLGLVWPGSVSTQDVCQSAKSTPEGLPLNATQCHCHTIDLCWILEHHSYPVGHPWSFAFWAAANLTLPVLALSHLSHGYIEVISNQLFKPVFRSVFPRQEYTNLEKYKPYCLRKA